MAYEVELHRHRRGAPSRVAPRAASNTRRIGNAIVAKLTQASYPTDRSQVAIHAANADDLLVQGVPKVMPPPRLGAAKGAMLALFVVASVAIWLPLLAVILLRAFIFSPRGVIRWFRQRKERRRFWAKLARDGRTLTYANAKQRVESGSGTFVIDARWDRIVQGVWWIEKSRDVLDPQREMPSIADEDGALLSRKAERALDACAISAYWVEVGKLSTSMVEEMARLPNILSEHICFKKAALTGELSDPFWSPTGNQEADGLRAERERLLDRRDLLVVQAEYEQAASVVKEIKALEQKIREKKDQAPPPTSQGNAGA